jgi:hypothetical protein
MKIKESYTFTLEELKTIEKIIKNPLDYNIEFAVSVVCKFRKYNSESIHKKFRNNMLE